MPLCQSPRYRVGIKIGSQMQLQENQKVCIVDDSGNIERVISTKDLLRYSLKDYWKIADRLYTVQQMY